MALSILSAVTGRPLRSDSAVTGELTLHGRVMMIGGLKEKVLGAHSAGIRRVLHPRDNTRDLEEIEPALRHEMEFVAIDRIEDAVGIFLVEDGV
jgi:ATP-dependent Lon protease